MSGNICNKALAQNIQNARNNTSTTKRFKIRTPAERSEFKTDRTNNTTMGAITNPNQSTTPNGCSNN